MIAILRLPVKTHWESRISLPKLPLGSWGPSRFNFGAIRGGDCTVRYRVSDTSNGT